MKVFNTLMVLTVAFLAVFAETVFTAPREWLGAQIDLLPALMVFAALNSSIVGVSLLAVLGGLWFDSLSANPLGVTILPLMIVGFPIYLRRDLILRDVSFAQFVLGAMASAIVPVLTILFLLNGGKKPLIGWGSIWQLVVMTAGGAVATPVLFGFFEWCEQMFGYKPRTEVSFRPDREIRRGRNLK